MQRAPERRRGAGPLLLLALLVALAAAPRLVRAVTDATDGLLNADCFFTLLLSSVVSAINGLYMSLGSPLLPGWTGNGGDPCGESWQGVVCTGSSITGITMNAANLGGQLGSLGNFTAITSLELNNNNIGGTIPEDLPVTLQSLFLSANQLTGSIPSSLSKLENLTAMSVNGNHLNGDLPDTFDSLNRLVNLDISSNNLSGVLPSSMKNLASLTSLKNGNPFNTSIVPSASPPSTGPAPTPAASKPAPTPAPTTSNSTPPAPAPSFPSRSPPPPKTTSNSSEGSTTRDSTSPSKKHSTSTLKIVGFVLAGVVLFIIIVLLVLFCLSKYQERRSRYDHNRSQQARVHHRVEPQIKPPPVQQSNDLKKGSGEVLDRRGHELSSSTAALAKKSPENQKEHVINFDRTDSDLFPVSLPPPPPPPPLPPIERVIANPIVPPEKRYSPPPKTSSSTSATSFSIASLQQYTNSFREENVIRESRLGKVYLAELPDGKLLEVLKIDNANGRISVDDFLEEVECILDIKHPNILELVGYCAEYGQRLLVYNHFSRTTLDDTLHDGEDTESALSWNARLQVALGSGKALEYLHASFQPPIVHQNFEPANVLLDKKFSVCVAECGLAELMPPSSVTQLSGRMRALLNYEAPELQDSGVVSERGDVYSFGVVMLELLTGRKPYDSSRPRHEQHLVRWASSQLHDIESLSKMVDPSIRGQCSEKALSRFADIISRCIQQQPEFRPPMSEIVQDLARLVNATGEESE
ncbi:Protein STRUBBELIG-RECEPTOR FAMILY 8 [Zea mays]|uniref:Protein STRUBBELIG-RECEPTOR FAMILY 8 n=1 Tax=Zea mays TaxID=4577 RepID=A0A3L6DE31_MAIZE|nr:hypothetical protein Zm00014a_021540 [Zea mays]PWZ06886.1 Protein STRUBBELIG-RECEPTOR FAMILY 8 [Zea mays]